MNVKLEKAQDVFLNRVNQLCNKFGLNNIMAQLYAILYLSDKRLSLNEMGERLKISKGSVSVNIRALERYGAVRRVWVKGSRKDYYEAETDISRVILDRVKSMIGARLSEAEEIVNPSFYAINSVNPSNKEEKEAIEVFKQRLDRLKKLQTKIQSLFNLFNSGFFNNILAGKNRENKKNNLNNKIELIA